ASAQLAPRALSTRRYRSDPRPPVNHGTASRLRGTGLGAQQSVLHRILTMKSSQPLAVLITPANPALDELERSWRTAIYTDQDGIGPMGALHEAGDALVAVAQMNDHATTVLGSGVMIGPGLLLTATHVLDEFPSTESGPVFLTFLPDGARAWLPIDATNLVGPSAFSQERKVRSDLTLVSCTLNSDAQERRPLMLAPLHIALPLVNDRLWAFGYRHGRVDGTVAGVIPYVSSGLVTAAFPDGRGERLPSPCIEVAMDTVGGMSGGAVVNSNGDLAGIVSSSFEGGPTYVTLIWDALRLKVKSAVRPLVNRGAISLFSAKNSGFVRIKGKIKRRRTGDIVMDLSSAEMDLLAQSVHPSAIQRTNLDGEILLSEAEVEQFEEQWGDELETEALDAAVTYLEALPLAAVQQRFLSEFDASQGWLESVRAVTVEDFQGLEDPEILSVRTKDQSAVVSYAFELLSVVWTIQVPSADFPANAAAFSEHFVNVQVDGEITSMDVIQRLYFEAELVIDLISREHTQVSISKVGVFRECG
ncbi:serine protease, partial [Variovorax sp. OV329]|uniref:trypsin-like serine peptidase n=1 Tax=Variovorax sp. OV329 TaxID=1882825 RepID=UPI0008EBEE95